MWNLQLVWLVLGLTNHEIVTQCKRWGFQTGHVVLYTLPKILFLTGIHITGQKDVKLLKYGISMFLEWLSSDHLRLDFITGGRGSVSFAASVSSFVCCQSTMSCESLFMYVWIMQTTQKHNRKKYEEESQAKQLLFSLLWHLESALSNLTAVYLRVALHPFRTFIYFIESLKTQGANRASQNCLQYKMKT